jgi:hypothetical protein
VAGGRVEAADYTVPEAGDGPRIIRALRDDTYTTGRHTLAGRQVIRDLRRGRDAHVFDNRVNLLDLELRVWTEGAYQGTIRGFERFMYRSPAPIGRRTQAARDDLLLHWVEIKGRLNPDGDWEYHMVPRSAPAQRTSTITST